MLISTMVIEDVMEGATPGNTDSEFSPKHSPTLSVEILCSVYILSYAFLAITSGNHTPGSRSYSDLLDTWADSVCTHQLVSRPYNVGG